VKKEAFQEIAKHFAESIDVKLVFEDGACPATNGKTIILPTEMNMDYVDQTLGALLHETAHIRFTDFNFFKPLDQLHRLVGNALEDIRIDCKSLRKYPNSKCFYTSLIEDVFERSAEQLAKEELPMKKLKAVIIDAFGMDIERLYGKEEKWEEIKKCVEDLRPTMYEIYDCAETKDIHQYIDPVLLKIFETDGKSQPQQQAGNPQGQPCNGGQGGEGANSQGSGNSEGEQDGDSDSDSDGECDEQNSDENEQDDTEQKDDQQDDSNIKDESDKINEAMQKYKDALEKTSEIEAEKREATEKTSEASQEWSKAVRSGKTYNTKARKLESKSNWANLTQDEVAKMQHYKNMAQQRKEELEEIRKEYYQAQDKLRSLNGRGAQETAAYQEALAELKSAGFGQAEGCNLLGFNALDTDKLMDKNYVEIEYNPTLDEVVKEVLILKQEQFDVEETGRINPRYLHEIYTDVENLFQEKDEKKIKTRVSIVVDQSGSMSGSRTEDCLHAINLLAEAFRKAINQGAPGDMRIYAFADDVAMLIDNVDNYKILDVAAFSKLVYAKNIGGGTNLARAVNHVVNDVEGDPEYRNIIIIITDAEVNDYEISNMVNNISFSDARVLYVAVSANFSYCPNAKDIFGDNNIVNKESACEILERVMFQGVQSVN